MYKDKEVSVRFRGEDIKKMLINKTGLEDNLAELIMGNLAHSQVGLEQITKALLGIFPVANYKVGDFIYVPVDILPSWKMDREATKKLESCFRECIMAQIIKVDLYSSSVYQINCTVVLSDSKVGELDTYINESDIKGVPEKPEDILEIIENLNKELPF